MRTVTTLVLVALLVAPAAAASWASKGETEPSTALDREGGFMFDAPDVSPDAAVRRVYFNGFASTCLGNACPFGALSPNSATLGSAVMPFTSYRVFAMLGVWKDCNRDGYVGHGDNLLYEYRVELLPPENSCAARPGDPTQPGFVPVHNDGTWVRELLPIGWEPANGSYAFNFVDQEARVWADMGLPTDTTSAACQIAPQPSGTFHTTGGLLAYLDCQADHAVTRTINSATTVLGVPQLGFNDVPDGHQGRSSSPLNQPTLGNLGETEDGSHVRGAFDCAPGRAQRLVVTDPTHAGQPLAGTPAGNDLLGEEGAGVAEEDGAVFETSYNPNPAIPTVGTEGSFWGTVNQTQSDATDCTRADEDGTMADWGYCPDQVTRIYVCEQNFRTEFRGRTQPDHSMFFNENGPADHPFGGPFFGVKPLDDALAPYQQQVDAAYGRNASIDGGTRILLGAEGFWGNRVVAVNFPLLERDGTPAPVHYVTFYAYVSPGAVTAYGLTLPSATAGSYGAEACAASALDGRTRFQCDREAWWKDKDGKDIQPRDTDTTWTLGYPECVHEDCTWGTFVGDPYNLRDVDCYDEGVAALRERGLNPHAAAASTCE